MKGYRIREEAADGLAEAAAWYERAVTSGFGAEFIAFLKKHKRLHATIASLQQVARKERKQVKELAVDLLNKLKASKFTLDWRKNARARARVRNTIGDVLDELPEAYSDELFEKKCSEVYEHVYESYYGDGASKYAAQDRLPS